MPWYDSVSLLIRLEDGYIRLTFFQQIINSKCKEQELQTNVSLWTTGLKQKQKHWEPPRTRLTLPFWSLVSKLPSLEHRTCKATYASWNARLFTKPRLCLDLTVTTLKLPGELRNRTSTTARKKDVWKFSASLLQNSKDTVLYELPSSKEPLSKTSQTKWRTL